MLATSATIATALELFYITCFMILYAACLVLG